MSGIKNIKKKLKGFHVRPPNAEVIKKVLLHIPYVVVFYVVNKCTWLYQYCRGSGGQADGSSYELSVSV